MKHDIGQTLLVSNLPTTVLGNERQALPVSVVVTVPTLEALLEQSAEQFLTVAADGGPGVRVYLEGVRDAQGVPGRGALGTRRRLSDIRHTPHFILWNLSF